MTIIPIGAPERLEYLWNGSFLDDRDRFTVKAEGWHLSTDLGRSAVLTAGSPGTGAEYALPGRSWWSARGKVSLRGAVPPASAQLGFFGPGGRLELRLTRSGDRGTTVELTDGGGNAVLCGVASPPNNVFDIILDNTCGGGSLRLHITGNAGFQCHLLAEDLPEGVRNMLGNTTGLDFSASRAGGKPTVFSDLYFYDLKNPFEGDPAAALAFLEGETKRVMSLNKAVTTDGRTVSLPDISHNYYAEWLADNVLMAMYTPEYQFTDVMINDLEFILEHAQKEEGDPLRPVGLLPDHVNLDGETSWSPGDVRSQTSPGALSQPQWAVMMLDCILKRLSPEEGRAFFDKWEGTLMRALEVLPKDENGLVYNDAAVQYSTFGFIDTIAVTGACLNASVYLWNAYRQMARWQETFGRDSSLATAAADRVEACLEFTFYNEAVGLLNAATGDCNQPDVMGSCFALSLGFPFSQRVRDSVGQYLVEHYDEITQFGALRHLPAGDRWEKTIIPVPYGEYMNGAYWPVFTGWMVEAIRDYSPKLARRAVDNLIAYGYTYGFHECINGSYRKLRYYIIATQNILPAARELLRQG